MHQIQSAERGLPVRDFSADPRFVPAVGFSLREVSARLLRSTSTRGLRLADRLDHQYA
jgi:hypothetical protein